MPNWCQNVIIVAGDAKQLKEFRRESTFQTEQEVIDAEQHEVSSWRRKGKSTTEIMQMEKENIEYALKQNFTLHKLIPQPKGEDRPPDSGRCEGGWDWYSWRLDNWGIKWDMTDTAIVDKSANEITYRVDTPWGPPIKAFERISSKFPELSFLLIYMEAGMGFMGKMFFENGVMNELVAIEDIYGDERIDLIRGEEHFEEGPIIGLESNDPEIESILEYGFGLGF